MSHSAYLFGRSRVCVVAAAIKMGAKLEIDYLPLQRRLVTHVYVALQAQAQAQRRRVAPSQREWVVMPHLLDTLLVHPGGVVAPRLQEHQAQLGLQPWRLARRCHQQKEAVLRGPYLWAEDILGY
jgi:hypothetical protein